MLYWFCYPFVRSGHKGQKQILLFTKNNNYGKENSLHNG